MPDIFPTARFGFMAQEIDVERATLEGGESIAGSIDRISTDGGGRVFAEFGEGQLIDRDTVLAWRAVLGLLDEGVTAMVVPFCDARHQPTRGKTKTTYGDGTLHSDGTPFAGSDVAAQSTADAPLRAVTISFAGVFPRPLIGGEWFSISHPNKGWRAYKVRRIEGGKLSFVPPLREAVPSGTDLEFSDPRCLMVQDGRAGSPLVARRQTTAAIRFVEAR